LDRLVTGVHRANQQSIYAALEVLTFEKYTVTRVYIHRPFYTVHTLKLQLCVSIAEIYVLLCADNCYKNILYSSYFIISGSQQKVDNMRTNKQYTGDNIQYRLTKDLLTNLDNSEMRYTYDSYK